jgi:ADP-ribose pyrophosphatase
MPNRIIQSKIVHQGRTFDLVSETVALENGVHSKMEYIRHPGASAIVPFRSANTILLIQQYRHAVGGFIWEIPAGTLKKKEDPLHCAQRELAEETGFAAKKWKALGCITPVPSYSDERIHIFRADMLTPAQQHLDPDEIVRVKEKKLTDVVKMVEAGKIYDSKTLAALFVAGIRSS